jgi:hypothetical protein
MDTIITIDTYLPVRQVVEPHTSTCNYPSTRFASWCQFFPLLPDMGTSGNPAIPQAPLEERSPSSVRTLTRLSVSCQSRTLIRSNLIRLSASCASHVQIARHAVLRKGTSWRQASASNNHDALTGGVGKRSWDNFTQRAHSIEECTCHSVSPALAGFDGHQEPLTPASTSWWSTTDGFNTKLEQWNSNGISQSRSAHIPVCLQQWLE